MSPLPLENEFEFSKIRSICYVVVCFNAAKSGVYKKVRDQMTFWKEQGIRCRLSVATDEQSVELWKEIDPSAEIVISGKGIKNVISRNKLMKIARATESQIIYVRDAFPMFLRAKKSKVVVEIQTFIGEELKIRSKTKFIAFILLRRFLYKYIDAAIFITHEIMERNELRLRSSIPTEQISNGINITRFETLPIVSNHRPAAIFIGHPNQSWHGLEVIKSLACHTPRLDFHIVGYSEKSEYDNLFFHGELNEISYRSIAKDCIVALGPMRTNVKGLSQAAPLKVREYLSMGLPVIINYKDVDLSDSHDFVLQLSHLEPINENLSKRIINFVELWRNKRVPKHQIQLLSIEKTEIKRLQFLSRII